jgi:adenylate kinase family enzyme
MTIHISGAPGSGKSTFGVKLKKIFKNIKILDLDDLFDDFINKNKFNKKAYQNYLDTIINKNKNIIFVGLNKDKGSY